LRFPGCGKYLVRLFGGVRNPSEPFSPEFPVYQEIYRDFF